MTFTTLYKEQIIYSVYTVYIIYILFIFLYFLVFTLHLSYLLLFFNYTLYCCNTANIPLVGLMKDYSWVSIQNACVNCAQYFNIWCKVLILNVSISRWMESKKLIVFLRDSCSPKTVAASRDCEKWRMSKSILRINWRFSWEITKEKEVHYLLLFHFH